MERLPLVEELSPRQAEILELTLGPLIEIPLPFKVWANSTELCYWVEGLGAYCRNKSVFPQRLRELSVLIAARHFDSPFAWHAHYDQAVGLGVPVDSLDRLARREDPRFGGDEAIFYKFAREMLEEHFVTDKTYQAALGAFGEQGVVDLIGCIGSFSMSAMMLNTFQLEFQPPRPNPFPDVDGSHRVGQNEAKR